MRIDQFLCFRQTSNNLEIFILIRQVLSGFKKKAKYVIKIRERKLKTISRRKVHIMLILKSGSIIVSNKNQVGNELSYHACITYRVVSCHKTSLINSTLYFTSKEIALVAVIMFYYYNKRKLYWREENG